MDSDSEKDKDLMYMMDCLSELFEKIKELESSNVILSDAKSEDKTKKICLPSKIIDPFAPTPTSSAPRQNASVPGVMEEKNLENIGNTDDFYEDSYIVDDNRIRLAIIFNHSSFDSYLGVGHRLGSSKDTSRLLHTLKSLNFDVKLFEDASYKVILTELDEVATLSKKDVNCLAVVVLTHGGGGGTLYAHDKEYNQKILFEPFLDKPALVGIPKLFVIQACRGMQYESGISYVSDSISKEDPETITIPKIADIIWMYSTFEDYFSWRNTNTGSWFIQTLCDELDKHGKTKDLLQILLRVNHVVAYKFSSFSRNDIFNGLKQMPEVRFTLTKNLSFRSRNAEQTSSRDATGFLNPASQSKCIAEPAALTCPAHLLKTVSDETSYYNLNSDKKKIALLINNYSFNEGIYNKASEQCLASYKKDYDAAFSSLGHLGFDVMCLDNPTLLKIEEEIEKVAKKSAEEVSCVACVVMTQGLVNHMLLAADQEYSQDKLSKPFLSEDSKLTNVPKIFIILANRSAEIIHLICQSDGSNDEQQQKMHYNVPKMADILWIESPFTECIPWKREEWSWYTRMLFKELKESNYKSILHSLTQVNRNIAEKFSDCTMRDKLRLVPKVRSTFTKFLSLKHTATRNAA